MNVTPTILILTAKYGSGHMQAAKALATEFEKEGILHCHFRFN